MALPTKRSILRHTQLLYLPNLSTAPDVVGMDSSGNLSTNKAGAATITVSAVETTNYKSATTQFSVNLAKSGEQAIATQNYPANVYGKQNQKR